MFWVRTVRTVEHGLPPTSPTRGSVGRLLTSPGCWEKSLAETPGGAHHELEPLLTRSAGAAVLSRVVLEFRVKLHEMNRVTQKF